MPGPLPDMTHTPRYSPATVKRLEKGDLRDAPLSDCGGNSDGDQEMVSREMTGLKKLWERTPRGQPGKKPQ